MIPIELRGTSELQDGTMKGTFVFSDEFEEAFVALKRKAKKDGTKLALVAVSIDKAEVRPVFPDILSSIRDMLEKGIEVIDREAGQKPIEEAADTFREGEGHTFAEDTERILSGQHLTHESAGGSMNRPGGDHSDGLD